MELSDRAREVKNNSPCYLKTLITLKLPYSLREQFYKLVEKEDWKGILRFFSRITPDNLYGLDFPKPVSKIKA